MADVPDAMTAGRAWFQRQVRWSGWEWAFWAAWGVAFFVPQANLVLLTHVLVWGLFALSLDLLLGQRGIASLGHAAFYGIGAYVAGFLGKFGWTEPISGLLLSGLVAGVVGLGLGRVLRGLQGVALLMVTLGLNMMLYDAVQRATDITGGDDGLQGVVVAPLLGSFRFDMAGRTGYLYVLAVVLVVALAVRALLHAPWGLALLGARDSARRMLLLGAPVERDVTLVFGLSAAIAGLAGALMTQTTGFVSPEAMSFQRSADVLVVLVIGGTGVLYGGFVGALLFLAMRDLLAALNPIYWYFWIGLLLVLVVSFFRAGIVPTLQRCWRKRTGASA
jgi:branched-chain amino acid transport system permease protein